MKGRKIKDFVTQKKIFIFVFIALYLVIFILNRLTMMYTDDFAYLYSFATGERIESIGAIFSSMKAHYYSMNGRLVLHFFVQLFLMLPPVCFDLVNSAVYVLLIMLIYYFSYYKIHEKHNIIVVLVIAALLWIVTPAYGQVYLWLDGACNYLWGGVIGLLYMIPYVKFEDNKLFEHSLWKLILYSLCGFLVGMTSESFSMAVILWILISIVERKLKKEPVDIGRFISFAMCVIGYITMLLSPGTIVNKAGIGGLMTYIRNFVTVLVQYRDELFWHIILWIILMVISIYMGISKKKVYISAKFMFISLAANFVNFAASYYPLRGMYSTTIFLILADVTLLFSISGETLTVLRLCLCTVIISYACSEFIVGSVDILGTYLAYQNREEILFSEKELGNMDLELPVIVSETKYSAVNGLKDLATDMADTWPNVSMSRYYGVNSIIGIQ